MHEAKKILVFFSLATLILIVVFVFMPRDTRNPEPIYDYEIIMGRGNLSGNISQGAFVAYDDGWVFLIIYNTEIDTATIYRMRPDGSEMSLLNENVRGANSLNAANGWLYFGIVNCRWHDFENRLHRMRADGADLEALESIIINYFCLTVADGWIYFTRASSPAAHTNLYRMRSNGTRVETIVDANVRRYDIVDNWIFYNGTGAFNLYKMDIDTGETIRISEVFFMNGFVIYDEWVYYLDGTYWGSPFTPLMRMRFDGSDIQTLVDNSDEMVEVLETLWAPAVPVGISSFIIDDGWIYYTGSTFQNRYSWAGIYRMRVDGSDQELFHTASSSVSSKNIIGDWLYYTFTRDNLTFSTYRIRLDGTGHQNLDDMH